MLKVKLITTQAAAREQPDFEAAARNEPQPAGGVVWKAIADDGTFFVNATHPTSEFKAAAEALRMMAAHYEAVGDGGPKNPPPVRGRFA